MINQRAETSIDLQVDTTSVYKVLIYFGTISLRSTNEIPEPFPFLRRKVFNISKLLPFARAISPIFEYIVAMPELLFPPTESIRGKRI